MEKQEQKVPETISLTTKEGFLMFLEDMTQEYVDSIKTKDELSVVALLLWGRMVKYEEEEDYRICSIIKEKMGMVNIKGKKLLKV
jgi:hypothetical protein